MKFTRDSFNAYRLQAKRALEASQKGTSVLICAGTGCIAGGSLKIYENIKKSAKSGASPSTLASSITMTRKRVSMSR